MMRGPNPVSFPATTRLRRSRPGMTLVEVMVALAFFAVAILGSITVFIFSLRSVDDARSFTQVTQILNHEMEAMRMRGWTDRQVTSSTGSVITTVHGLHSLGTGVLHDGSDAPGAAFTPPGGLWVAKGATRATSTFKPFAVYGVPPGAVGVAVIGGSDANDIKFTDANLLAQYRNATGKADGFECQREVVVVDTPGLESVTVNLLVRWGDLRGMPHERRMSSTMSKNGLNRLIYDSIQVQ